MGMIRSLARGLLAPIFIYGGYDTLQNPAPRVKKAEDAGTPDAETMVRANAGLMVGAGFMLLMGVLPRLAATLLAASLIPTTLAGHPFWKLEGPERKQQLTQFFKNLATIGGLLLYAAGSDED